MLFKALSTNTRLRQKFYHDDEEMTIYNAIEETLISYPSFKIQQNKQISCDTVAYTVVAAHQTRRGLRCRDINKFRQSKKLSHLKTRAGPPNNWKFETYHGEIWRGAR